MVWMYCYALGCMPANGILVNVPAGLDLSIGDPANLEAKVEELQARREQIGEPRRVAFEVTGEVAEYARHRVHDVPVDLDAGHRGLPEHQRREDVASAARPGD